MPTNEEENLKVVQRFIDGAVNRGDLSVVDRTWADDLLWNGGSLGSFVGRPAFKRFMETNASGAWEGMQLTIHEAITSGDKVVLRFTNEGRNVGPFLDGLPTGKRAKWLGIGIYTVYEGRITKGWLAEDILDMLMQLGVFPPQG